MSQLTTAQLEQLTGRLFAAGRGEASPPGALERNFEAVASGRVVPLDPPVVVPGVAGSSSWWAVRLSGIVLGLALAGLWWAERPPPPLGTLEPIGAMRIAQVDRPPPVEEPRVAPVPPPEAAVVPDVGKPRAKAVRADVVEPEDALERELALVDQARQQVKEDPGAALNTLATRARQFPKGVLQLEADVVRVEALVRVGRRAEAQQLADRLIAGDSGGLMRARLSKLLAPSEP